MKIRWLPVVLALALVAAAFAAFPAPRALAACANSSTTQFRSIATGNWGSNSTWECSDDGLTWQAATVTPASSHGTITIRSPHVVTIATSATVDQVTVDSGGQLTVASSITWTLADGTGTDLSINGTLLNQGGTWTSTGTWAVGAGGTYIHNTTSGISTPLGKATLDAASNFVYRGSSSLKPAVSMSGKTYGNLSFENTSGSWNTGTLSGSTATIINGNFAVGSGVTFDLGTLVGLLVAGNWTNSGTFTPGTTGTVTFNGASTQTLTGATTFYNLTVNAGSTLATVSTITVNTSGVATINGAFQLNTGGWATGSGAWTYDSAATLIFNSSSSYGVNATDVYWPTSNGPQNVTVRGNGLTMNSGASRTVAGTFQTAAGVTNGNNLTLDGTTQINAGGYFDTNSPTYGTSSTLVYNPGGSYNIGSEWKTGGTVGSGVPKNVTIQNSTAVALPNGAGSRTVVGVLTIGSGSSLSLGANIGDDLNVGGNWVNNGTFNANNRAVTFTGTTTVSGSSTTSFAYVTINGTLTGHSGSMNVANDWTNNGTFNHNGGAVHFNGTGGQAIGGSAISSFFDVFIETFSSVTGPAGGTINVAGNWINNGAFNHNNGAVHFNGTGGQAIGGSAISSFFDIFIETFSSVTGPAGGTLNVAHNWTNNGTFNANNGNVAFNGGSAQSIGGTASTTFAYLTINNAAGVSLGGDQAVDAVLNLSAGRLALGANSLTLAAAAGVGGTPGPASMVIADGSGFLKKASAGSLSFTFPVGDAAGNYTPVALNCPTFSAGSSADVRLTAGNHPNNTSTSRIQRYWTMQSAAASVSCTGTFSYVDGDVFGTEALIRPIKWDGAWHALSAGSIDTGANTLTGGFTSFSAFTGGDPAPLAVTLASLNAAAQGAAIQVTWETVSEVGNAGFNLYRDTSPAGPGVKLNAGLIPSQGPNSPSGFSYIYTDAAGLVPGTTYTYWLEDVSLGGIATRHEPVSATYAGPNAVSLADFRATTAGTLPRITRIGRISVLAVFGLFLAVVGSVGGAVLARRRG